jgi:hypothetical protein
MEELGWFLDPAEYSARKAAAKSELDRQVEAWHLKPVTPTVAKAVTWMAGLLTTAALIGFAQASEIGPMVAPVLVMIPAICFSGHSSGLSDGEQIIREHHRAKAYTSVGSSGFRDPTRGPSFFDRLSMLIGPPSANRVADKATTHIAKGVSGPDPTDVRHLVRGDGVCHMASNTHEHGPVTKIRLTKTGAMLATHTVDGKLQATAGRPSSVKIDADGKAVAAAWHDGGQLASTWRAGTDDQLTLDVGMLAGEIWTLANEIRYEPGCKASRTGWIGCIRRHWR